MCYAPVKLRVSFWGLLVKEQEQEHEQEQEQEQEQDPLVWNYFSTNLFVFLE